MNIKYVYTLAFAALLAAPTLTQAYYTTDQTVTQYTETTSLYTIDYYFGSQREPLFMPAVAIRDLTPGSNPNALGYEVLVDGETPTDVGTAAAVIVGDVPVVDGMYKVPAGQNGHFTLYLLLTTDNDTPEADYALHVTKLPFFRGEIKNAQALNIHELTHYQTPEVEFNGSNPSAE